MDQELDEFEVLWPAHAYYADASRKHQPPAPATIMPMTAPVRPKQRCCSARSWPVDVPRAALVLRRWEEAAGEEEEDSNNEGSGEKRTIIVPPHLRVSGRWRSDGESSAAAYYSATLRSGRQRDLRRLRNSVLRMTGFIEG